MNYTDYPPIVAEDIARLRRRIAESGIPTKQVDRNLIIGTWNIRNIGDLYQLWEENADSPKRNLRALAYIAEIIRKFDVLAVQEVKRNTTAIRYLLDEFLGADWDVIFSDVTIGERGNTERLAYIYDKRRVQPSGLAGEIVLAATDEGNPTEQFDRTPYIVGFRSANEHFALLTAHIRYGKSANDRLPELKALSAYIADEIIGRTKHDMEICNLIVLGDFNIDDRGDNPLFKAFASTGLVVPKKLLNLKTTYNSKPKYYDQIAWFMGELNLLSSNEAGVINFADAVYKELSHRQMSYRVSDHFPLWVEFLIDRSEEQMAKTLGIDPAMPAPFSGIPD